MPQRHGQADGWTDGRTTYDSNTALALRASRGKNRNKKKKKTDGHEKSDNRLICSSCEITKRLWMLMRDLGCSSCKEADTR